MRRSAGPGLVGLLAVLGARPEVRACDQAPDGSELVPRDGATRVPLRTVITVADSDARPSLTVAASGAAIPLQRTAVPGMLGAKAYRAADPLPADADLELDDGRTFHTAPEGAALPAATVWEIAEAKRIDPGGGCGGGASCAPQGYRILLRAAAPGDEPGYFNLYADTGGTAAGAAIAYVKTADVAPPSPTERAIWIAGDPNVPAGAALRVVPVDLRGNEGTPLGPVTYPGPAGGGGCRTASPAWLGGGGGRLAALLFLLLMMVGFRRGRPLHR